MRVLVTGGRDFGVCKVAPGKPGYDEAKATADAERTFLLSALDWLHVEGDIARLGHGCATGADTLAGEWAAGRGIPVSTFKAQWEKYGNTAGIKRNISMLAAFRPTLVIAFPGGTGTAHMVQIAREKGLEVRCVKP